MRIARFAVSVLFIMEAAFPAAADPAQPAPAVQSSSPDEAAAARPAASSDPRRQIVCRYSPPPTGSRFGGGRECHTADDWNQRMREEQLMTQRYQSVPFNSNCVANPMACNPVH